jgi:hypothetical protein
MLLEHPVAPTGGHISAGASILDIGGGTSWLLRDLVDEGGGAGRLTGVAPATRWLRELPPARRSSARRDASPFENGWLMSSSSRPPCRPSAVEPAARQSLRRRLECCDPTACSPPTTRRPPRTPRCACSTSQSSRQLVSQSGRRPTSRSSFSSLDDFPTPRACSAFSRELRCSTAIGSLSLARGGLGIAARPPWRLSYEPRRWMALHPGSVVQRLAFLRRTRP